VVQKVTDPVTSKVLADVKAVREYVVISSMLKGPDTKWKIAAKL
jgi:hypothetical protein